MNMGKLISTINHDRRKRLGQFFSGVKLGKLLAALATAEKALSIIDPMAGSGDLLQGCLDVGANPETLGAIEIDSEACLIARERLPGAHIVHGDAFNPEVLNRLPIQTWDLVIGNPPFVRYQEGRIDSHGMPDAKTVRMHLLSSLSNFYFFDKTEKDFFLKEARNYSGLADLAVPACLLAMAMVRHGGKLALILPQAWLSRDYSRPIRSCLDAFFDIELIAVDDSGEWFPDTLVKTCLLVARRHATKEQTDKREQLRVDFGAGIADEASLVGKLIENTTTPELDFAAQLWSKKPKLWKDDDISIRQVDMGGAKAISMRTDSCHVTDDILTKLANHIEIHPFNAINLSDLSVEVSQGFRSGANDFFYVTPTDDGDAFLASDIFGGIRVECPAMFIRPAVRGQRGLKQAVLDLRSVVLPEDMGSANGFYGTMPAELSDYVRKASKTLSGKPGREKLIPELSAVRTNIRAARNGMPPRFWYMLPDFKSRHIPDAYIPRVCASKPIPTISNRKLLVDANFITFRCNGKLSPLALMAILSSTWTWTWLEHVGAVLGGGALKIESTMLSRLPIPTLNRSQIERLEILAHKITNTIGNDEGKRIDEILLETITPSPLKAAEILRQMAEQRLRIRSRKQKC